eukprot:4862951-Pyramimonas_sp.AAC.1
MADIELWPNEQESSRCKGDAAEHRGMARLGTFGHIWAHLGRRVGQSTDRGSKPEAADDAK